MLKRPSNEAAVSEETKRTLQHVEPLSTREREREKVRLCASGRYG